jgi:hypothetical protein
VPAVAVKDPVLEPAAMVTEAGTVSDTVLLESATVVADGAVWLSETVQVEVCDELKLVGLQLTPVNCVPPP